MQTKVRLISSTFAKNMKESLDSMSARGAIYSQMKDRYVKVSLELTVFNTIEGIVVTAFVFPERTKPDKLDGIIIDVDGPWKQRLMGQLIQFKENQIVEEL